jgi:DNA-binding Lrp family transcriptional regulator
MEQRYLTTDLIELKEHATFNSQQTMDDKIYEYIEHLRANEEPQSVIDVLLFFGRSSLRVLGVSFAKYETIADSINKSKSTVIRAVRTLKEYGIIDVIPTTRKWSSYGHSRKKSVNVVRIMANVTPQHDTTGATDEHTPVNKSNVKMHAEPINNKHTQELLHNTSSTSPYVKFKQLITDKKLRNKIYGVWLAHVKYIRGIYDEDTLIYSGIKAVMVAFKTKGIRNLVGYYNGVLDRMLDRLHDVNMQSVSFV